jgi:eukaryotic-like serine/threonine-protein kinase
MSQEYTVGQRVGDYEILAVLGAGGMGKVYKVRNVISDRIEAMKVLLPNLASQKELADRFLREIKVLASLNHPNIAALRTALTLDDQLVMIMEYVEGVTLSSRLQSGPLLPAEAINYVDQVLAALSYAHHLNIVHRDIKPANMILTPQGIVKLMDFGIARSAGDRSLTMTGTMLGSVNYIPPEQVNGETCDARSDIYSLGASLYELVTGQLPFRGDSNYSLMSAHVTEMPQPPINLQPGIPDALNQIILIALAKEPEKRFQSADAFRAALKSVHTGAAPVPMRTDFPLQPVKPATASGPVTFAPVSPATPAPLAASPILPEPSRTAAAAGSNVIPLPPPSKGNQRVFYVALGALLVTGMLFAAALYLPRRAKTQANVGKPPAESPAPAVQPANPPPNPIVVPPANPQPNSVVVQPATPPGDLNAANTPKKQPPSKSDSDPNTSKQASLAGAKAAADARAKEEAKARAEDEARAKAAAEADLEEAKNSYDQVNARSSAVARSLDSLEREQRAQGLGLRGDVVSAQQRMDINLGKALSSLQNGDSVKAKKYMQSAERDLEFLEKFLGR